MQCDKYERGSGKKGAGRTHRTNEQDHRGGTDREKMTNGKGGEISTSMPQERHPLGLSVDPEQATKPDRNRPTPLIPSQQ